MASTTTVFAPLPSISLSDKMHKTDRASTVHAGIMWQRAAKHFLSSASAWGGGGCCSCSNRDVFLHSLFSDKLQEKWEESFKVKASKSSNDKMHLNLLAKHPFGVVHPVILAWLPVLH